MSESLKRLLGEIRACRICEAELEPRPVIHATVTAKILVASQAPGIRVHRSGQSFNDTSGDRLREWMGVTREQFYDERRIALDDSSALGVNGDGRQPERPSTSRPCRS